SRAGRMRGPRAGKYPASVDAAEGFTAQLGGASGNEVLQERRKPLDFRAQPEAEANPRYPLNKGAEAKCLPDSRLPTPSPMTSDTSAIAKFAIAWPRPKGGAMGESEAAVEHQLRKFQKELSAGSVSLVLLAVLEAAGEPMYGYQIAKRLERFGGGVLSGQQSALYPVLRNP